MTTQATRKMKVKYNQRLVSKCKSCVFGLCLFGWPVLIPLLGNVL